MGLKNWIMRELEALVAENQGQNSILATRERPLAWQRST